MMPHSQSRLRIQDLEQSQQLQGGVGQDGAMADTSMSRPLRAQWQNMLFLQVVTITCECICSSNERTP